MSKWIIPLLAGLAAACSGPQPEARVAVGDGWARATKQGQPMGAAYLTITNTGGVPVTLEGATSPVAAGVGLHGTRYESSVARMRPLDTVRIEPGETRHFSPGSDHLMLEGLGQQLVAGSTFPITLDFAEIEDKAVEIAVVDAGSR